jgi:hypothetical protein
MVFLGLADENSSFSIPIVFLCNITHCKHVSSVVDNANGGEKR